VPGDRVDQAGGVRPRRHGQQDIDRPPTSCTTSSRSGRPSCCGSRGAAAPFPAGMGAPDHSRSAMSAGGRCTGYPPWAGDGSVANHPTSAPSLNR
jgi:hypothetical protein